jgi:hypothetical protein
VGAKIEHSNALSAHLAHHELLNEFWASYGCFRARPDALAFGVQPGNVPQAVDDGSIAFIGICNCSGELHANQANNLLTLLSIYLPAHHQVSGPLFAAVHLCELWVYLRMIIRNCWKANPNDTNLSQHLQELHWGNTICRPRHVMVEISECGWEGRC